MVPAPLVGPGFFVVQYLLDEGDCFGEGACQRIRWQAGGRRGEF